MDEKLDPSWQKVLVEELNKPYFRDLMAFVEERRQLGVDVYPVKGQVFAAFNQTPFDKVKVVIIGQDPYHGPGQAEGMCFSVPRGTSLPPSLKNIFLEMKNDLGIPPANHGHLASWAEQGVLLLNAILTVERGKAMAHANRGWETFTDAVIAALAKRDEPVVFVLWGRVAQKKVLDVLHQVDGNHHVILQAPHPSPFSAHSGFLGSCHFSKVNGALERMGATPVNWELPA